MSVVTEKSFEYRPPSWVTDPNVNPEDKRFLLEEMGLGEEFADCDAMELSSQCFCCGKVLVTPYIYWHGSHGKGISLHPECAQHLAKGILRDAQEIKTPLNMI